MEFRILGPLEVAEGGVLVSVGVPKQRALLAVLLLHANEVVSAERLVDELWGEEPPARAAKLVQHYVSGLRKVLPAGLLLTRAPGYLLRVEPGQLDLIEFERLLEEARRAAAEGEVARAADLYRHALSLWHGERALDGADLAGQGATEASGLDDLRLAAQVERADLELELGRHVALVGGLEELVERHRYKERLWAQLMLALYRSGRQAEALDVYQTVRRLLLDELGLEPNQELQQLEHAILQQDPSLDLPAAPRQPTAADEPAEPRRKTVTVLAAALTAPQSDPEVFGRALSGAFAAVAAAAAYHGGRAERLAGGELIAVFGVPEAHEDDALRALRAADGLRSAELRLGIATGEVLAEGTVVTGEPVAAAVRLAAGAEPGEIFAAEATLALGAGAVEAEGARVVAVAEGRPAFPQRTEAHMVGRGEELDQLRELFAAVAAERRCRVTTVFGEAGIGKTRLARELVAALAGEARLLVGRCVAYGEGATYLPLREALREVDVGAALAGTEEGELVAQRLAEVTGEAEGATTSGEGFWAVRLVLEALTRDQPLLLVLDDVHWAEPTFLDLVDYLAEWSTEAPILVLCLARPDLVNSRPAWGGATSPIVSIRLERLSTDDSQTLVAALGTGIAADKQALIAEAAEGNPLYAEQLTAYVEERGSEALHAVPPTIQALLAGRLDRLTGPERTTLERAAVVGREFTHGALVHLLPPDAAGAAGRHLLALARRGLVRPAGGAAATRDVFRFHHVLIRDVAYAGIPKEVRADLHERHADWLDPREPDDALVGYHLEQAYRLRGELGEKGGHSRRLAVAAGERLGTAGIRAWKNGDAPAATNLLGRSVDLLPVQHASLREYLCELGIATLTTGEVDRADEVLGRALESSLRFGDKPMELRARVELGALWMFRRPAGELDQLLSLCSEAMPLFAELGDDRSLGRASLVLSYIEGGLRCHYRSAEAAAVRAIEAARRSGWHPSASTDRLAAALFYGPTPAGQAIARCEGILDGATHAMTATVSVFLGGLLAMTGSVDGGRASVLRAKAIFDELGWRPHHATSVAPVLAEIEVLAGDAEAAAQVLLGSCALLEELDDRVHLSTQAANLADALYATGRNSEAEEWLSVSQGCTAAADVSANLSWRRVKAKLLARAGAVDEAEGVGREALRLADETDALNHRARVRLDLGEVLKVAGREGESSRLVGEAGDLYRLKGNVAALLSLTTESP